MPPKSTSASRSGVWYDKHRKCQDGSMHEGVLELITWDGKDDDGDLLGWGGVFRDEAAELKETFEKKYGGDPKKFFDYWPQGFRWTCCGCTGNMPWGCDHHGSGSTPCRCDFCVMGKRLPDGVNPPTSQSRVGLSLKRGPDPRSFNPAQAAISEMMRGLFGMDTPRDRGGSSSSDNGNGNGNSSSGGGKSRGAGKVGSSSGSGSGAAAKGKGSAAKVAAAGSSSAGPSSSAGGSGKGSGVAPSVAPRAAVGSSTSGKGAGTGNGAGGAVGAGAGADAKACASCGKAAREDGGALRKCGSCKAVRYCSQECQAAHWPMHKGPCKRLRQQQEEQQKKAAAVS